MSLYNRFPMTEILGYENQVFEGSTSIREKIESLQSGNSKHVTVIDCYVGVDIQKLFEDVKALNFDTVIFSNECAYSGDELTSRMQEFLTDDRVFGIMNTKKLSDFFIDEKIEEARKTIENTNGKVLVIGVGASLITKGNLYIYADIARWEIQLRYRAGMPNWNATNTNDPILSKYKRGYFMEWRICDKHKIENYDNFDFVIDADKPENPIMITYDLFRKSLAKLANQPFRLVPYFDSGVWGGQWMKDVCNLDKSVENYAWAFDGVPEENSLLFKYGETVFETPAINLVFLEPQKLLGEKVYARYGKEFPIRFDFLDTMGGQNLSLQVHPLTEYIQQTFGMHYTQDESYYILDAREDSCVYLGVKNDADKESMIEDLKIAQTGEKPFDTIKYVNKLPAKKHDHFLIPAGTMHCSGANTVVLEISATPYIFTFKLWDWDRLGLDGLPRPVHIEHGEKVINMNNNTDYVNEYLVNHIKPIEKGEHYTEESTGLTNRHSIETRRHTFTDTVVHKTHGSVNMLNLVEGDEVHVESMNGEFEPFIVHYAETFVIPENVKEYKISPTEKSKGQELKTIKAFIR